MLFDVDKSQHKNKLKRRLSTGGTHCYLLFSLKWFAGRTNITDGTGNHTREPTVRWRPCCMAYQVKNWKILSHSCSGRQLWSSCFKFWVHSTPAVVQEYLWRILSHLRDTRTGMNDRLVRSGGVLLWFRKEPFPMCFYWRTLFLAKKNSILNNLRCDFDNRAIQKMTTRRAQIFSPGLGTP